MTETTNVTASVRQDCKKRPRLGGDIITVLVGLEATATRFFVHADLVSQHSDFFQACLKKGWKEAEERIVRLPDLPHTSSDAFENFHSFLYTGKVYTVVEGEENAPGMDREWIRIMNAWILGEVLLSTSFKDAAVDALIHKLASNNAHSKGMYALAYRYSSEGSAIRRLMLDLAVTWWDEGAPLDVCADSELAILAPFFRRVCSALLKESRSLQVRKQLSFLPQEQGHASIMSTATSLATRPCFKGLHADGSLDL